MHYHINIDEEKWEGPAHVIVDSCLHCESASVYDYGLGIFPQQEEITRVRALTNSYCPVDSASMQAAAAVCTSGGSAPTAMFCMDIRKISEKEWKSSVKGYALLLQAVLIRHWGSGLRGLRICLNSVLR